MSAEHQRDASFYDAVRAGVKEYLGRDLTDKEFADMRDKIAVIERGGTLMLEDANFVIGDALFRHLSDMKSWFGKWVIKAFFWLLIATVCLSAGMFEAGRCTSMAEARLNAWKQNEDRLTAIQSAIREQVDYYNKVIKSTRASGGSVGFEQVDALLIGCNSSVDTAIANTRVVPSPVDGLRFDFQNWIAVALLSLPAFALVAYIGYKYGRIRREEPKEAYFD